MFWLMLTVAVPALAVVAVAGAQEPLNVGSRLELFVDGTLVQELRGGAERRLHEPVPREVAIVHDQPWEGSGSMYTTVFRDGPLYRMYYRGHHGVYQADGYEMIHEEVTCYAESTDGVAWTKPELGLFEFAGSTQNNIILTATVAGDATHNFCPFVDTRPGVPADERYKALGGVTGGLRAFVSADGVRWRRLREEPVITVGAFDSQNLAFWDAIRGEYREYHRDSRDGRDIRTSTSQDFANWTEPVFLDYAPGRVSELYTSQIIPYYRAPHIFLGFPTRYLDRGWSPSMEFLPQLEYRRLRSSSSPREGTALTDGMLMSSRDGQLFQVWPESFIRPGPRRRDNWFYGDNYQSWGLVETQSPLEGAPDELSIYVSEGVGQNGPCRHRRFTLRVDGFVSVWAPLSGGELTTRPLVFEGRELVLNSATSAAGSVRVELQGEDGVPLPGRSLDDCAEVFGDSLERVVPWRDGGDVGAQSGKPVRLRFELRDADLYSFRFR